MSGCGAIFGLTLTLFPPRAYLGVCEADVPPVGHVREMRF